MKKICIYYSLNNHVRDIVKGLEDVDLVEIKTVKKLPTNKVWQMVYLGFLVTRKKELEIQAVDINFDEYEEVIIASPIWAGKIAIPIISFLTKYKMKDKKITLLISCSGNDAHDAKQQVEALVDASNQVVDVKLFGGN